MNNLPLQIGRKKLTAGFVRSFSVTTVNNKDQRCKLLVIGGGSGGCTMAAKFNRRLKQKGSVIVLEPSDVHYYQPLWTLVGGGVKKVSDTARPMKQVLPGEVGWIRDRCVELDPVENYAVTQSGDKIHFEYVIVAAGIQNDYKKVPGLSEALDDPNSGVSTIYSGRYAEKTFDNIKNFRGGNAIFTYPDTPIKCPGAPQKIAYLADSYFRMTNARSKANVVYNTCLPVIFGVPKYAAALMQVVRNKGIEVNYRTVLAEIRTRSKEAVFNTTDEDGRKTESTTRYDLLHVTPPMSPPDFIKKNARLACAAGYLNVDKHTLQHVDYPHVWGIGDCTNTPNSKTIAAIAKQCYVLEKNLVDAMNHLTPRASYNGYGACPLVTSYNTCIMAEFIYDGVVRETLPINQARESHVAYYMKRDLFPFIYWRMMLNGRYHGPEFIRRIVNPFAK